MFYACPGLLFSVLITAVITDAIKDGVGRPRPDFFWRCFPDGKGVGSPVHRLPWFSFSFHCVVYIFYDIVFAFGQFFSQSTCSWWMTCAGV